MSQNAQTYTQIYGTFAREISDGASITDRDWWVSLSSGYKFDRSHGYEDVELFLVGEKQPLAMDKTQTGEGVWVFGGGEVSWIASPKIEADGAVFGSGRNVLLSCTFGSTVTAINGPFTLACDQLIERRITEG